MNMLRVERAEIDRIKERINIVEFIGCHVDLRKRGRDYSGLCPFHVERKPSFTVSEDKGFYYCFGCGAHGDVIDFVKESEAISFVEALEFLALDFGISLPRSIGDEKEYTALKINSEVMQMYKQEGIKKVPEFLRSRHIPEKLIDVFHIGYASLHGSGIVKKYRQKIDILKEIGLIYSDKSMKEKFLGRLIFPIIHGKYPVGFGARRTVSSQYAKYINSKASFIYNKSRVLFGLAQAKKYIRDQETVYLVEGYVDVLSLWTVGIKNTVACCGTVLTKQQAQMLSRMSKAVYLIYDSDTAGKRAAYKAVLTSLQYGLIPYVIELDSHDPNECLCDNGVEYLVNEIKGKTLIFYEYYNRILKKYPIQKKIQLVKDIQKAINLILDSVTRYMLQKEVARYFDVPYGGKKNIDVVGVSMSLDSQALVCLVDKQVCRFMFSAVEVDDYVENQDIFLYLYSGHKEGKYYDAEHLLREFKSQSQYLIKTLTPISKPDKKVAGEIARRIRNRTLSREIKCVNTEIGLKIKEKKDISDLEKQFDELRTEKILLQKMTGKPQW